jgi:hypothetical protein
MFATLAGVAHCPWRGSSDEASRQPLPYVVSLQLDPNPSCSSWSIIAGRSARGRLLDLRLGWGGSDVCPHGYDSLDALDLESYGSGRWYSIKQKATWYKPISQFYCIYECQGGWTSTNETTARRSRADGRRSRCYGFIETTGSGEPKRPPEGAGEAENSSRRCWNRTKLSTSWC